VTFSYYRPMRVLIADDDRLSSRMLEASLNASGYEVIVAGDGGQAWQVLKNDDRPQIAILDWMMPVMDGLEVCRRVRRSTGPYVYILLLTGNTDPDSVVTGMDAGADDYIRKPFHPAELKARTIEALQRTLEGAGVELIDENGGGPGVRLKSAKGKGRK